MADDPTNAHSSNTANTTPADEATDSPASGTTNTVSTGIGSVSQISGGTFNFYGSPPGQNVPSNPAPPSNPSGTPVPLTLIGLNTAMKRSLNEDTMRDICQTMALGVPYCGDLDYNGLPGGGWQNKTLSLIDYCKRRRALTGLIDTINDAVGNAFANPTYQQWRDWAASMDQQN